MRGRRWLAMLGAGLLAMVWAGPAFGHATFPAAVNPLGTTASPYPGGSAQYIVLRVPEERAGPPKLDNVDVKVIVPEGWTNPVCQDARSASGTLPGAIAAGWTCSVEPGPPAVLHWTRAPGATGLGVYFPFAATTGPAGVSAFVVQQTYSNGELVEWTDPPVPPGCTTGTNEAGTACSRPAPRRTVADPASKAYWLVASDGGIFSFGGAGFYGSTGDLTLNKPIVGMASTQSGLGYWLVASDGGIFAYGSAGFYGSTGDLTLNKPIVGMASSPSGLGYWLVASDGGIFAYGDAVFYGSTGDLTLAKPVTGITSTPSGGGYWMVASDGGLFTFGNADFFGSGAGSAGSFVGMALTPSGSGYWLATSAGQVQNYGDAPALGSTGPLNLPVVGIAAAA